MDAAHLLILTALGLLGGLLSGLVGVSGGSVFVPALVYVAGWRIEDAVAASLVVMIFGSLSGTLRNARSEDPVDWRVAALFASTVAPSSLIGVAVARVSPQAVVESAFAVVFLALAYPMFRGGRDRGDSAKRIPLPLALLAGVGIGTMGGLVGIGGTVALVPLMVGGYGLRTKAAISTSLAVVLFVGIVGGAGYVATGFGDLGSLPPLIAGSVVGAWLGVRLRDLTPETTVRRGFAIFMVIVAARLLADAAGIS